MAPPRLVLELTPEDLRRLRGEEEEEEKQAAARAARAKQIQEDEDAAAAAAALKTTTTTSPQKQRDSDSESDDDDDSDPTTTTTTTTATRLAAIQRAEQLLYASNSDSYKQLQSRAQLAAAHAASAASSTLARRKQELERLRDAEAAARMVAHDEQQRAAELEKQQKRQQALLHQRDARLQQLEDLRTRLLQGYAQQRREGKAVLSAALGERERAVKEQQQRRAEGRALAEQLRLANEQLRAQRIAEIAAEQAQDEVRISAAAQRADEAAAARAAALAARRAAGDARRAAVAERAREALVAKAAEVRRQRHADDGLGNNSSSTVISSSTSSSIAHKTTPQPQIDKRAALDAHLAERQAAKQAELEQSLEDLEEDALVAAEEQKAQLEALKLKRDAAKQLTAVWRAQAEQRRERKLAERGAAAAAARAALEAVRDEQIAFGEVERQVKDEAARRGMRVW